MVPAPLVLYVGIEISAGQVSVAGRHGPEAAGDPVAVARSWVEQGAAWLHVADLDAAAGTGSNAEVVAHVVAAVGGHAHVQLAGGLRDDHSLAAAAHLGVRRLVIDAAALGDLPWVAGVIERHPARVAVDITAHADGIWAPGSPAHGAPLEPTLEALRAARCGVYVVTDVDGRGARHADERAVLRGIAAAGHGEVLARGGITRLEDLHALAGMTADGVHGAVLDDALLTGAFTLAEAEAAAEPRYDPYEWGPAQP
jgi:phosphoribosylformimino-5-aminoimidazole carboxamide ribonucleotide (ProFAR) isomerase